MPTFAGAIDGIDSPAPPVNRFSKAGYNAKRAGFSPWYRREPVG